jgi:hypothetical protein
MITKFDRLFQEYVNTINRVPNTKKCENGSCRKKKFKKKQVNENVDAKILRQLKKQKEYLEQELKKDDVLKNKGHRRTLQDDDRRDMEYELKHVNISIKDEYQRYKDRDKRVADEFKALKDKNKHVTEAKKNAQCTKVTQKSSSSRKDKKWMKCEKQPDGSIKRIHWGDPNAKVTGKSGNTKRKKSFRARHNCSNAKKGSANDLACRDW